MRTIIVFRVDIHAYPIDKILCHEKWLYRFNEKKFDGQLTMNINMHAQNNDHVLFIWM